MKVLFIASLGCPSSSGRQRLWALQRAGLTVKAVDKSRYRSSLGRTSSFLAKALKRPRLLLDSKTLEQDVLDQCRIWKPDIVWFEWPREVHHTLFAKLRNTNPKPFLISFVDDNPWGLRHADAWIWKEYLSNVPLFDLHLVKRESDIENLKNVGAKDLHLWEHGIYSPLFFPRAPSMDSWKYPVSFIGTCMDSRADLVRELLEAGIPLHVFGTRWDRAGDLRHRYPDQFHGPVVGEDYGDVLRESQVCLGLVSASNRDEWTMRTFEVAGCGSAFLAERTLWHENHFKEGVEAEFFSSSTEAIRKLKELIAAPSKCSKMGAAARERFVSEDRTLDQEMVRLLANLQMRLQKQSLE